MNRTVAYLKEVRTEMSRVTWPSKKELRSMSMFTIAALATGGIAIWLLDTGIVATLTTLARM